MAGTVHLRRHGNLAILTIDNPPINALAHPVRAALLQAVEQADADVNVRAIVVHATGTVFVGGADIGEFEEPARLPLLNDTLLRLERCAKPVIAAMHGTALGGGLELALASHYRMATPGTMLGLPEVKLGLLPGSGGTQRLPRLIGPRRALDLMLSGDLVSAATALQLGFVDRLASDEDVLSAACAWASELLAQEAPPRRVCDMTVSSAGADESYFHEQRKQAALKHPGIESSVSIVRCVEASLHESFDAALALSRQLFEQARTSAASRALRHLFFAERGTKPSAAPRPVQEVAVIGAGTMGSGIAISLASGGFRVVLVDTKAAAAAAGMERVRSTFEASVAKGRLSADAAKAAIGRVRIGDQLDAAIDADLVIEAVFENMQAKREVFAALDRICKPGVVLATNTSTLDIDRIAAVTERSAEVVGMHFFSPANIMRLVELVRGRASSDIAIATALAVTKRIGKLGIVVGNCFGFVGNRMLYCYGRESQLMVLEGAGAMRIDRVLKNFGMAMGPNAVGDLAGLDVGYRVRRERSDLPSDPRYYRVADIMVEAGRLGQKTGRGTFLYSEGSRSPVEDPEANEMIAAEAARLGVSQREFDDQEIVDRCILALVNEGARILEEGVAASSADIDAIWCNGYGFPRFRGGPMYYADSIGLPAVLTRIRELAARHGDQYWAPAPLLERLVDSAETFAKFSTARAATAK